MVLYWQGAERARPREPRDAGGEVATGVKMATIAGPRHKEPLFMPAQVHVAIAQPLVVPGDLHENVRRMTPLIADAAARGADLVLFSECGITGYDLKRVGVNAAIPLNHPIMDSIADLGAAFNIGIVAGLYENLEGTIHNSAVAFLPDGRRIVQRKHNVIALEKTDTPTKPGPRDRLIFEFKGLKFAILICADSGIPNIFEEMAEKGVDAILAPTAGLGTIDWAFRYSDLSDEQRRKKFLDSSETVCFPKASIERAMLLNMGIATSNQAGWVESTGYFQPGHSVVIDRTGNLSALIPGKFAPEFLRPELAVGTLTGK
jgi:predicted amidohydrolase